MLRYLKRLQNKDLALDHSMISLVVLQYLKLNATSEMIPVTCRSLATCIRSRRSIRHKATWR